MKFSDDMTYYNFSILEVIDKNKFLDHNLVEDYLSELISASIPVTLEEEQYKIY